MRINYANPQFDLISFGGGYDTETRPWNANPGKFRESQNYEIGINGQGVVDIQGYEIYSGQPSPSDAAYSIIDVTITGTFSAGDTITQLVSGATAVVLEQVTTTTPNYLVVTKKTGTFNATDALQVSAVTEGTASSLAKTSGGSTPKLNAQYINLAADNYRADIAAIPGSGVVLGIHMLNDIWYGFRNNADGSAAEMYKKSASGWTAVALGRELSFASGGTYVIAEGDVITGATSTNTAIITRVILESGSFAAGTAAGRLIFASQSDSFESENLNVGGNLNVATITGDSTAITLAPSGRYEFIRNNFGGIAGAIRLYGCDGVNRGFEFDGTVFAPINSTMTTDRPTHVYAHKNHLFFSFSGSAQHSGIGTPYIWSPIFGASEIAVGDTITGFMSEPGSQAEGAIGIYSRNTVHILYGSSTVDWNLVKYRDELGAFEHSLQQFGQTMFLDDRGITTFKTVQAYGNFQQATVSRHIQRFVNSKKTLIKASCIARDKNQYRLFFTDKTGLYITTEGDKVTGLMPILFKDTVNCIASLEDSTGAEVIMFGSSDGKVYQLDKGTSFDGDPIVAYFKTFFSFAKSIRYKKKYLGATMEATGGGYAEFSFGTELEYNSSNTPQPSAQNETLNFTPNIWDAFIWDIFTWDGITLGPSNVKLEGSGQNISIVIRKNSDYFTPINLTGVLIRYVIRRQLR